MVGELIRREALSVERTKAGFIAEKRTAGHGHATREKNFDRSIEPDDWDTGIAQKFGSASLGISPAAESEDGGLSELRCTAEGGMQLLGFQLPEGGFAVALKKFRDGNAGGFLDALIQVDKAPPKLTGKAGADGGLTSAHETSETNHCSARLRASTDLDLVHDPGKRGLIALQNSNCTTVGGEFDLGEALADGAAHTAVEFGFE
jgi:hypothetical protein